MKTANLWRIDLGSIEEDNREKKRGRVWRCSIVEENWRSKRRSEREAGRVDMKTEIWDYLRRIQLVRVWAQYLDIHNWFLGHVAGPTDKALVVYLCESYQEAGFYRFIPPDGLNFVCPHLFPLTFDHLDFLHYFSVHFSQWKFVWFVGQQTRQIMERASHFFPRFLFKELTPTCMSTTWSD